MTETYISVDVETDGPLPIINSLLSIGAVAYDIDGRRVGDSFYVNLLPLEGAVQDPNTMEFWRNNPTAWEYLQKDQVNPKFAMNSFNAWIESLPGKPVMIAYPSGFDFTWIYCYSLHLTGKCPFGWSCLDIKTLAWAARLPEDKLEFLRSVKKNMPKAWFRGAPRHDHIAINDAIGQGILFCNIVKEIRHGRNDKATSGAFPSNAR